MKRRRAFAVFITGTLLLMLLAGAMPRMIEESIPGTNTSVQPPPSPTSRKPDARPDAQQALERLVVKGRASKTGYERSRFGSGWALVNGCSTRDIILYRDLENTQLYEVCRVVSGTLIDPYTASTINFSATNASAVQIDHVVALSDAWQKGAQDLTQEQREQLANDPLELLAVDGPANQQKGDADAATWLPSNKSFRCEYVARQIAIKIKYMLWVTPSEKDAMASVLRACPSQPLP